MKKSKLNQTNIFDAIEIAEDEKLFDDCLIQMIFEAKNIKPNSPGLKELSLTMNKDYTFIKPKSNE